ncbi:MAG: hypothetical protein ACLTTJ_08265 [Blautia sp.]
MSVIAKMDAWEELFRGFALVQNGFSREIWIGSHVMAIFLLFFLAWTCVIATGFLAVIVSRTVLINSRFAGIVSFILFFAINAIVEYIYDLFAKYGLMGIHSGLYIGIGECAFYIVACIILFVISSVLAEKKLSV